jgi:NAD(P)-dependent dehydrogenase (short-subunit alcohol dehydrogenase family)
MAASSSSLPWRTAWITGGSTGIGRELALQLAAQGVRVAISARSADTLKAVAAEHPLLAAYPLDVTDAEATRATAETIHRDFGGLDLVILNAGVWDPMSVDDYSSARATRSMLINYTGITNALEPVLQLLRAQGKGYVALVASVSGYRGLPTGAAYAPTKAAIINLAECLKPELKGSGVRISVISPGFVATPMTSVNAFPMPFIISASDAATRIIAGLKRRPFEIAFPWPLVRILKFLQARSYPTFFFAVNTFIKPKKNVTEKNGSEKSLTQTGPPQNDLRKR